MRGRLLITAAGLVLLGCGGGGGENNPDKTYPSDNVITQPANTVKISGKVVNGYIRGARVCLDKNRNYKCDESEPFTVSG